MFIKRMGTAATSGTGYRDRARWTGCTKQGPGGNIVDCAQRLLQICPMSMHSCRDKMSQMYFVFIFCMKSACLLLEYSWMLFFVDNCKCELMNDKVNKFISVTGAWWWLVGLSMLHFGGVVIFGMGGWGGTDSCTWPANCGTQKPVMLGWTQLYCFARILRWKVNVCSGVWVKFVQ